jgi:hypothetical protein
VHAEKPPLSSWQMKLTPASVSEKTKLAEVAFVGLAGFDVIGGAGGAIESTWKVLGAAGPVFPAASVCWTWKVCEPCERPEYGLADVQAANDPTSSLH